MAPELALMLSDAGRPLADQFSGAFPPEAAKVVLYAALTTPLGRAVVAIVNAAAIVKVTCFVTD